MKNAGIQKKSLRFFDMLNGEQSLSHFVTAPFAQGSLKCTQIFSFNKRIYMNVSLLQRKIALTKGSLEQRELSA